MLPGRYKIRGFPSKINSCLVLITFVYYIPSVVYFVMCCECQTKDYIIILYLAWLRLFKQASDEGNSIRLQALKCNLVVAYKF